MSTFFEDSESDFFPEITHYELIRGQIAPEFAGLPDAEIDEMLGEIFAEMSPEEIEGFWGSLKKAASSVGRTLVRAAPTLLPIAGGALGTLIGGPAGTAIGAKLGGMAGKFVGSAAAPRRYRRRRAVRRRYRRTVRGRRSAVPAGGSSATAQLLSLLSNPALLQSLLSRVLGARGRAEVVVDAEIMPVEFGSFMTALGELAAEAAREAHEEGVADTGLPEYLLDEDGTPFEDVGRPEVRAEILLELLNASVAEEQFAEYEPIAESPESWLMETGLLEIEV